MTFRSTLAALALLGLGALSPFVSPARAAEERYVVNYRADAVSPWLVYTRTRGPAQARSAVAELKALGYQAEYVTGPVGPVYSGGTYYYAPGYTYYPTGASYYGHYQYNDHTAYHYHDHDAHHYRYTHHHRYDHRHSATHPPHNHRRYDIHHRHGHHHHVAHYHPRHHHARHHPRHHHVAHHHAGHHRR
jgi:hypothetical protein